jgi:Tfp pilus assembly protein PilF
MMEEASSYFKAALRELPRNVRALEGLAEYYQQSGDSSLASEYRRRAYALKHGN